MYACEAHLLLLHTAGGRRMWIATEARGLVDCAYHTGKLVGTHSLFVIPALGKFSVFLFLSPREECLTVSLFLLSFFL